MTDELLSVALQETDDYFTVRYASHEEWLIGRRTNPRTGEFVLGGSDAASVENCGFLSPDELRDELRGVREHQDLSGNKNVERGVRSEPHIRALYDIEHPDIEVADGTHIVFYSKKFPWMSCSLDCILFDIEIGEFGTGEIKSVSNGSKWGDYAPDNYFLQVVHQMFVTGWEFGVLHGRIVGKYTRERSYRFTREAIMEQGSILAADEKRFLESVKNGKAIPYKIPIF